MDSIITYLPGASDFKAFTEESAEIREADERFCQGMADELRQVADENVAGIRGLAEEGARLQRVTADINAAIAEEAARREEMPREAAADAEDLTDELVSMIIEAMETLGETGSLSHVERVLDAARDTHIEKSKAEVGRKLQQAMAAGKIVRVVEGLGHAKVKRLRIVESWAECAVELDPLILEARRLGIDGCRGDVEEA
jgi:erythromycin esterase-like protein